MINDQIVIISVFLILSIFVWMIPFVSFVVQYIKGNKSKPISLYSLEIRLIFASLFFVGALWCLRFSTSYYEKIVLSYSGFSVAELVFDSLLQSLQTMTMSVDSFKFIILVKSMIEEIYCGKYVDVLKSFYGIYISILDLLAPITSAAALFSILTAAFPKLKLRCSFFRKQYYFSELNERSIALAKSIMNTKTTKFLAHPVLVFTDVYLDDKNEKSSEFYLTAKKLGAICVKDDIAHLKIKTFKEKEIYLMDENESGNIKHLSEFSSETICESLKNTFIYVFYQDDSYALIENKIKIVIAEQHKLSDKPPVITRVKEYDNLIFNLLSKKPLIEPLLRNYKDGFPYPAEDNAEEYNLTIIGSGKIGMQMLLSSSWCGQFYGYKLNINVVSNENGDEFENNINNCYPEFIESTKINSPLLKVYNGRNVTNEPYFNLRYGEYDFNKTSVSAVNCISLTDREDAFRIIDSDYFLIALGTDEANMLAAEKIKKQITIKQYRNEQGKCKNRIIAFAVYNQNFSETLKKSSFDSDNKIELYPFGSIDDTYSYQNITMLNQDPAAILVEKVYLNQSFKEKTYEEKQETQIEQNKKIYDIMSSKAREVHFKYRIFSAFLLNKNDVKSDDNDKFRWDVLEAFDVLTLDLYSKFILSDEAKEKKNNILQYLTWLEHRRWNAYIRSVGFSYDTKKDKNIELKFHGCLCECSINPLCGHSNIRIDDLKKRLFDYAFNIEQISTSEFALCVNEWKRLPEKSECIQTALLLEHLDDNLIQRVIELKKSKNAETTLKKLIDEIVEACLCQDDEESTNQFECDMLDLASVRNGHDMKYFDFPQKTDSGLVGSSKDLLKEIS